MGEKHMCGAMVSQDWSPCNRNAKYFHESDGKWYCGTHYPPNVEEKQAKRNAKWAAECEIADAGYAVKRARIAVAEAGQARAGLYHERPVFADGTDLDLWDAVKALLDAEVKLDELKKREL